MGITIGTEEINVIIGYIGDVFTDFSTLILLIVGVALGLMVIGSIISIIKR